MLGGYDGKEIFNDVWNSADGETWTESKPPNDKNGNKVFKDTEGTDANWWLARADHTSVVFKDKIWVLGGYSGKYLNDVWSSEDGEIWTESKPPENADKDTAGTDVNWWPAGIDIPAWCSRAKSGCWGDMMEGKSLNDVWSSPDGSVWKKEKCQCELGGTSVNTPVRCLTIKSG